MRTAAQLQAPCSHFGPCGGCSLQSLAYQAQLAEKQNQVIQTLARVGRLEAAGQLCRPIIGANEGAAHGQDEDSPAHPGGLPSTTATIDLTGSTSHGSLGKQLKGSPIFRYRNKAQFTFSSLCWEPPAFSQSSSTTGECSEARTWLSGGHQACQEGCSWKSVSCFCHLSSSSALRHF